MQKSNQLMRERRQRETDEMRARERTLNLNETFNEALQNKDRPANVCQITALLCYLQSVLNSSPFGTVLFITMSN